MSRHSRSISIQFGIGAQASADPMLSWGTILTHKAEAGEKINWFWRNLTFEYTEIHQ
jgi:hypothetical protein